MIYTINDSGEILVKEKLEITDSDNKSNPLRFGMQFIMPSEHQFVEYYGKGPFENYSDRKDSARVGSYKQTVDEQYFPYARPQESGTKSDLRHWTVYSKKGNGLKFISNSLFSASALPFMISDLDSGTRKENVLSHSGDLKKRDFTVCHINGNLMGLGCINSWGSMPMKDFLLNQNVYEFEFAIIPIKNKI